MGERDGDSPSVRKSLCCRGPSSGWMLCPLVSAAGIYSEIRMVSDAVSPRWSAAYIG